VAGLVQLSADGRESPQEIDEVNRTFYSRFNYPWLAFMFPSVADPMCGPTFLNQEIGAWHDERVPRDADIWVAGCGTNQAVFTALRFPDARVLGTDLSPVSLGICRDTASQLGITNLELEERSINGEVAQDRFDYVVCTGVVHHNADPGACLDGLRRALKPNGILEVMVYNAAHRTCVAACQDAIRTLFQADPSDAGLEAQLALTRELIEDVPFHNSVSTMLADFKDAPDAAVADAVLQPVERSYTVASFDALLRNSGLEIVLPCANQFDKAEGRLSWNLDFTTERAARLYDALPDIQRWDVTNSFLAEQSPMLWFYAQRSDSGIPRRTERDVCTGFLDSRFERYNSHVTNFVRVGETYQKAAQPVSCPSPGWPADETLRAIVARADEERSMRDVFTALGIRPTFATVNRARIELTTPLFPYLRAVRSARG